MADRVSEAMGEVPRADFLPRWQRRSAHLDQALAVGHLQTCSQPSTVRAMLQLLDVRTGQRVLDVGSGTGWTAALLGHLVGAEGCVVGVEIVPQLVERGRANLLSVALPWVRIEAAEAGVLGWPQDGPYDRILVSAAGSDLPTTLIEQLAPAGVLVLPVGSEMTRVVRASDGSEQVTTHGLYRFVPLIV